MQLRERETGERRVLPFSVPPSRRTVRTGGPDASGTVLLFTGVRYSRPAEDSSAEGAAGSGRRVEG